MRIYVPQLPLTLSWSNVTPSTLKTWDETDTYTQLIDEDLDTWDATATYAAHTTDAPVQVQYPATGAVRAYQSLAGSNIGHTPAKGGTAWWTDLGPHPAKVQYQETDSTIVREYESLKAGNKNKTPVEGGSEWWLDLGPCNRDEMFDGKNNTRTVVDAGDSGISVKVTPSGTARYLALMGMCNVERVRIRQYATPTSTTPLSDTSIIMARATTEVGWWTWLFGSYQYRKSAIIEMPGLLYRPSIRIDLIGGLAECGQCFVCNSFDVGCTADGASPSLISYSTFQADEFGVVKYVPRQNARELNFTVWVETDSFDWIYQLLEQYESSLLLIDANHQGAEATDFDSLRVYGKITSIRPGIQYDRTPIDIRIQGLD